MEENRNVNSNDDDQLRDKTTNELLREETGGSADANLTEMNGQQTSSGRTSNSEDLDGTDKSQGSSYSPNDASGVRSGGTTDMDDQTAGGAGLSNAQRPGGGANITTKRNVTGSDFDGQVRT